METLEHPNGTTVHTDAPAVEVVGEVVRTPSTDDGAGAAGAQPEPAPPLDPRFGDADSMARTVWVGGIPANLVGSTETVLNINANKNIASLFMDFGEVVHSTVRVKTGLNKSWALVTFADREGAERAVVAGIEVMDVECEELTLKVELIDVAGHLQQSRETQGYLSLLAKTHQGSLKMSDLDTVWVGGLPAEFLGASEETSVAALADLCGRFGEIVTTTVRSKEGANKSWALVTFADCASVELAVQAGMFVPGPSGADVELRVEVADVQAELLKGSSGYLAHVARRHDEEVEYARAMVRGWWDRSGLTAELASGRERRFSIEKKLQRFRPMSLTAVETAG